ncbi:ATP-binding response regulator [Magnetococcus sp. PR-3]|uniref:ATP-binding response regulator n=1 Tax=Magnetococcus sp. PR-3 TaxID=3120355 RepID=UPI002FCDF358
MSGQDSKKKMVFKQKAKPAQAQSDRPPWLLGVVDDEPHLHEVTEHVLRNFTFEGRRVKLVQGYSGAEAKRLVVEHPDMAVLLLDVVMESDHAGLDVVEHVRGVVGNRALRILLRTGQAGLFPEDEVFEKYDINDYLDKAELSAHRMKMALKAAFRSYGTMRDLERAQQREQLLRQAAEEASQAKSDFVASLGHELRSPTQSIMGFNSHIMDAVSDSNIEPEIKAEIAQFIRYAQSSSERLAGLINNLLDLSKLESGRMEFAIEPHNIWDAVSFVRMEVMPQLQQKNLTLELPESEQPLTLQFDMGKTIQVLVNLFTNAIKFTPEGGTIRMETQPDGEARMWVSVVDSGRGVPEQELEQIFGRYQQASSNGLEDGGTGLGLAISREICQRHGGSLKASNNADGVGACFSFSLAL